MIIQSTSNNAGSFYILDSSYKIAAFSFFNNIFIAENTNKDEQQIILQHERAHVNQWHSLDIVFYELLTVFFWFNPVTFLLLKELRNVHEYLVDKEAVKNIQDKTIYCELLIAKAAARHALQFTHSFIYINTLKNRIMMITKNTRISVWRYTIIIPLIGMLTYFSSCSKTSPTEQQEQSTSSIQNEIAPPETMPEFKGGTEALYKYLSANINYPPEAKNNKVEGRILIKFMVDENGKVSSMEIAKSAGKLLDEEALRVLSIMPAWIPANDKGKNVACKMLLPISFKLE
ncbi:MAG: TonB family protein [Bacteroidia bacterium]|nr:TonB family protein [Bacteroidia bacterium]